MGLRDGLADAESQFEENITKQVTGKKKTTKVKGANSGLDTTINTKKKVNRSFMLTNEHTKMLDELKDTKFVYDNLSNIVGFAIEKLYKSYIKSK